MRRLPHVNSAWTTVAVALISATSTLAGVGIAQWAALVREKRVQADRVEDRRHQERAITRAERHAQRQALLDRRVEAHESFLLSCQDIMDDALETAGQRDARSLTVAVEQLHSPLTRVRMFGSDDCVVAAEAVLSAARDFNLANDRTEAWDRLRAAVAGYRATVRNELQPAAD